VQRINALEAQVEGFSYETMQQRVAEMQSQIKPLISTFLIAVLSQRRNSG
jgi:hypothetical protein